MIPNKAERLLLPYIANPLWGSTAKYNLALAYLEMAHHARDAEEQKQYETKSHDLLTQLIQSPGDTMYKAAKYQLGLEYIYPDSLFYDKTKGVQYLVELKEDPVWGPTADAALDGGDVF